MNLLFFVTLVFFFYLQYFGLQSCIDNVNILLSFFGPFLWFYPSLTFFKISSIDMPKNYMPTGWIKDLLTSKYALCRHICRPLFFFSRVYVLIWAGILVLETFLCFSELPPGKILIDSLWDTILSKTFEIVRHSTSLEIMFLHMPIL